MNHAEQPSRSTPPAPTPPEQGPHDVLDIIADVEKQLAKMRSVQLDQHQQISSLSERAESLERSERQLNEFSATLRAREQELAQQQTTLTQQREQAAHTQAQLRQQQAQAQSQIAAVQAQIEASQNELARRMDDMEKRERESAARSERERSQLEVQAKGFAQREQRLAEAQEKIDAEQSRLSDLQKQIDERSAALTKARQKMEEESRHLTARLEQAEARSREAETAAQSARRDQQDKTARTEAMAGELAAATKSLDQLTQFEKQAKSQITELREQAKSTQSSLSRKEAELADCRAKLDTAGRKLGEFSQVLTEQGPQLERGAAALAEVEKQRRQIEQLQKKLAEFTISTNPEEIVRKDQRIEELTEALRQARGQKPGEVDLSAMEQGIAKLNSELETAKVELQKRQLEIDRLTPELAAAKEKAAAVDDAAVKRLKQQLAAAQQQIASAQTAAPAIDDPKKMNEQFRAKAMKLKTASEHLKRRKARLARVREILQSQATTSDGAAAAGAAAADSARTAVAHREFEERARQMAQIQQQRGQLRQVQEMLTASEQDMIRRWARPRAISTLAWLTVFSAILALGSWVAASNIAPPTIVAEVTLQLEGRPGREVTPDEASRWNASHVTMLTDPTFVTALTKRLESRRMDEFRTEPAVADKLNRDMTIDASRGQQITLALTGTNADQTTRFLDTVATTIATESAKQAKQNDGPKTTILGERKESGQTRYASVAPMLLVDQRLKYAGVIFGISFVLGMMVLMLVYKRLMRAKRIFESDTAILAPEEEEQERVPARRR